MSEMTQLTWQTSSALGSKEHAFVEKSRDLEKKYSKLPLGWIHFTGTVRSRKLRLDYNKALWFNNRSSPIACPSHDVRMGIYSKLAGPAIHKHIDHNWWLQTKEFGFFADWSTTEVIYIMFYLTNVCLFYLYVCACTCVFPTYDAST